MARHALDIFPEFCCIDHAVVLCLQVAAQLYIAHEVAYARYQGFRVNWLGDVVNSSEIQTFEPGIDRRHGRYENDRNGL